MPARFRGSDCRSLASSCKAPELLRLPPRSSPPCSSTSSGLTAAHLHDNPSSSSGSGSVIRSRRVHPSARCLHQHSLDQAPYHPSTDNERPLLGPRRPYTENFLRSAPPTLSIQPAPSLRPSGLVAQSHFSPVRIARPF
ncbi:uncharacterized protein PAN0_001d0466 [Moesziomyces antarcticus]|uniref:uncharacterized protein n=1 Tax=Pseudozyma antarctica TaxID=84753 RepID=UPI00071978E0|nr:uncharacterized protein PAN0_001d0466 [Moesziomyces antarcticus]GAK62267.1 hypothetical protein PAN0_001d0466 [Moesziomyces antarcticus]